MTNSEKITLIRNSMPVTREKVYFNTGSVGPLSTVTTEALLQSQARELAEGRATMASYKMLFETTRELRQAFADLVKADPEEIALTHHTTDGMNIVTHGLDWQPGDELVITDWEHPGGFMPPFVLRQRRGVVLKFVSLEATDSPEKIVAKFEAAITPRTRLLVFSHVAWNTGLRLPLEEIVAMGHRHHVLSLVDGAQSAGAIPLDLPASGVDFYAIPGQKWLCGPEGTGALYVRRDRLSLLWPTFAGFLTVGMTGAADMTGYFVPAKGATRYEVGTINRPAAEAMAANLTWLAETVGWYWIHERIARLAEYANQSLSRLSGVTVITPPGPQAGLLTFNLEGYDPARVMTRLIEEEIILRFLEHPYALRISTGFYNSEADIDRLISTLETILAGEPEDLPEFTPPW
jgi:L-cysteine/cystine lyase